MYVINLGYLKDGPLRFIELLDGGIKEFNKILVGLNIATVIPETNKQNIPDLIDLETKRANKKNEKAKRRQQKKINLEQANEISGILLSPDASTCCLLLSFITFADGASSPSISSAPLSLIASSGLLFAISGRFLSPVTIDSPSSAILGHFLSAVLSCFLSLVTGGGFLPPVLPAGS